MLDGIPVGWVNSVGVVSVILLIGWLIFTDRLVPRRAVDKLLAVMEARLTEMAARVEDLTQRNRDLLEANQLSGKQAESLTGVLEVQNKILESVERLARRRQS